MTKSSITDVSLGGSLDDLATSFAPGVIIPVEVNHDRSGDSSIQALMSKIKNDNGRLDILVNNAFKLPTNNAQSNDDLFRPFWELPAFPFLDDLIDVGLRSHYVTSHFAAPLMIETGKYIDNNLSAKCPVIIHVSSFGGATYSFNTAYGVGKAAVDRLAKDMAYELRETSVKCISIYPGIVRTERMDKLLSSKEFDKRTGMYVPPQFVESPHLTGEVIASLFLENENQYLMKQNGNVVVTAEVAKYFGLKDRYSNVTPASIRSLRFLLPAMLLKNSNSYIQESMGNLLSIVAPDILLPMSMMKK